MTTAAPSKFLPSDADRLADPTGPAFPGSPASQPPAMPTNLADAAAQYYALQRDRDHLAAVAKGDPAARWKQEQLGRIINGNAPILDSKVDASQFAGAAEARTARENQDWDSYIHNLSSTTDLGERSLEEFDVWLRNGAKFSPENKRAADAMRETFMKDKAWRQRVVDGDVRANTQMRILSIWRAVPADPALAGKQPRLTMRG